MQCSEVHLEQNLKLAVSEPLGPNSRTNLIQGAGSGLKQKVRELETMIEYEVSRARSEAENLKASKSGESENWQKSLDIMREDVTMHFEKNKAEFKKFFVQQKHENARVQQEIQKLKAENTNLQQGLISLQRRSKDLEAEVGK